MHTEANAPLVGSTDQGHIVLGVTSPLSPSTTVSAGARYQVLRSDVASDYNEAAVFAGFTYTFK